MYGAIGYSHSASESHPILYNIERKARKMSNEQIARIYMELPEDKQKKFIAFLNQLLSEVQEGTQPLLSASDPEDC